MAMQHWDLARVAVTRLFCGCDEIECNRCTLPYRPPEQRTRRELIEDVIDAGEHANELREKIRRDEQVLELMSERMVLIRDIADPEVKISIDYDEEKEGGSCPKN